jgi:type I restriction enzyme S subunit
MMKKYKQYTNHKDCDLIWLNKIPEHWEILSFRNILVERNEKNNPIKSKERLSLSINKGVTLYADKTTNLDRFKDDFTNYKLAHEGDLVLNSMNMIVGAVGVSNYFGCVSPIYYTFTSDPNNCNSTKYYEYLFKSKIVQGVLFSLGRGLIAKDRGDGKYNTLRLKVSRSDLRSLKLPNPNYSEQTKIVSFLNFKLAKIDRFIRKKKQLIKLLNEQKAAIINHAVTKGLDPNAKMKPSGIDWVEEIPEHWEARRLKYDLIIKKGRNPEKTTPDPISLPYLSMEYLRGKTTLPTYAIPQENLVEIAENEVLILWDGANAGEIIKSMKGFLSSTMASLKISENIFQPDFWYYFLKSNERMFKQDANGTTIPHFNPSLLKETFWRIPPLLEQQQIVSYIEKETSILNTTISTIEKEIALVEEYKTSLIAEAVTGKIDVQDFEIPEVQETESYEEIEEELSMVAEDESEYENMGEN